MVWRVFKTAHRPGWICGVKTGFKKRWVIYRSGLVRRRRHILARVALRPTAGMHGTFNTPVKRLILVLFSTFQFGMSGTLCWREMPRFFSFIIFPENSLIRHQPRGACEPAGAARCGLPPARWWLCGRGHGVCSAAFTHLTTSRLLVPCIPQRWVTCESEIG